MRAKLKVVSVNKLESCEIVEFTAIGPKGAYGEDGMDEDNTYAKFSPQASLRITIANPALFGVHMAGETYYVDFTKVEKAVVES